MHDPHDPDQVGRALGRLLTAPAEERRRLAPRVVRALGEERFDRVVEATRDRIGGFDRAEDSPEGLLLHGSRGTALAWGVTAADGTLTGFGLWPQPPRSRWSERRRSVRRRFVRRRSGPVPPWWGWCWLAAAVAGLLARCWTVGSLAGWISALLTLALLFVGLEGYGVAAAYPWWVRRPVEAGALAAAASAVRLPELRPGGGLLLPTLAGAVLVAALGRLVVARRQRWGAPLSAPLRFPFDTGSWSVVQGGGRGLNHHRSVPEQRGALDLVRLGPVGFRTGVAAGRLDAYAAYGTPLLAPCDGVVVRAVDGLPDQPPGRLRYGPLYGNHVAVDTGRELVYLVHLRPGSLRVAVGERVTAGRLLGEVGNSGNSTEPHLHIHAERDGLGLDLAFSGVRGRLHRGRTIRTRSGS